MGDLASAPLRIWSADEVLARTDPPAMVAAIEAALLAMNENAVDVPPREHLSAGGTTLLVMPSSGSGLFATKLVTVCPQNKSRGLPSTQGIILVFDAATGSPIAMLDAAVLTGQRTGALAAAGVKALTASSLTEVGLVGCGVQGAWAAVHIAAVRPLSSIRCFARSVESFDAFCAIVARFAPGLVIHRAESAAELLEAVTCVVTATTSSTPVLHDDPALLQDKLLIAIGGYRPDMRELPEAAFRIAHRVIVDSPQARSEAGDICDPLKRGWINPEQVLDFSALDASALRDLRVGTRILKSVGHAAFDLFAAKLVLGL